MGLKLSATSLIHRRLPEPNPDDAAPAPAPTGPSSPNRSSSMSDVDVDFMMLGGDFDPSMAAAVCELSASVSCQCPDVMVDGGGWDHDKMQVAITQNEILMSPERVKQIV